MTGISFISLVGGDIPSILNTVGSIPLIGTISKIAVSFPLIYHYLGGLRHIVWDKYPSVLTNEDVERASYALVGFSALSSLGVSVLL